MIDRTTDCSLPATDKPPDGSVHAGRLNDPMAWKLDLPVLEKSETLYSWCASFHRRSCLANTFTTSLALFGDCHAARHHDFPAHLNALVARTGGQLGSAMELALNHTLLGFYLAFLRPERAGELLRLVSEGPAPSLKLQLGIPASRLGARHPLRFCRDCAREDEQTVGWPIWHLHHQLPAVLVCDRHGCPLWTAIDTVTPVHRRQFFTPPVSDLAAYQQVQISDGESLAACMQLACWASAVAHAPPGFLGPSTLGKVYRAWARRVGAVTPAGSIRYSVLIDALNSRLPSTRPFEASDQVSKPGNARVQVLESALRATPRSLHPAKHLELIAAMYDTWEALRNEVEAAAQAVDATDEWPGSRPAPAKGREQTVATEVRRREFLLAIQSPMSVRAAARLAGISTNTGLRWAQLAGIEVGHRPKLLSAQARDELRRRLADGEDRRVAAVAFGVALTTVNRLLSSDRELNALWHAVRSRQKQAACRSTLLILVRDHPGSNASQIRQAAPAAWAWLYRNDRAWLASNLPAIWQP